MLCRTVPSCSGHERPWGVRERKPVGGTVSQSLEADTGVLNSAAPRQAGHRTDKELQGVGSVALVSEGRQA